MAALSQPAICTIRSAFSTRAILPHRGLYPAFPEVFLPSSAQENKMPPLMSTHVPVMKDA